ncbi:MAG: hypothetical protein ABGX05_07200, partial [Pirellulaceae bacterium]
MSDVEAGAAQHFEALLNDVVTRFSLLSPSNGDFSDDLGDRLSAIESDVNYVAWRTEDGDGTDQYVVIDADGSPLESLSASSFAPSDRLQSEHSSSLFHKIVLDELDLGEADQYTAHLTIGDDNYQRDGTYHTDPADFSASLEGLLDTAAGSDGLFSVTEASGGAFHLQFPVAFRGENVSSGSLRIVTKGLKEIILKKVSETFLPLIQDLSYVQATHEKFGETLERLEDAGLGAHPTDLNIAKALGDSDAADTLIAAREAISQLQSDPDRQAQVARVQGRDHYRLPELETDLETLWETGGETLDAEVREKYIEHHPGLIAGVSLAQAYSEYRSNRDTLKIYEDNRALTMSYRNSRLELDFTLRVDFLDRQMDMSIDMDDLKQYLPEEIRFLVGDSGFLNFDAATKLSLNGFGQLDLAFVVDATNVLKPFLEISDRTGLQLELSVAATDIDAGISINVPIIGEVGIRVRQGNASLKLGADLGLADAPDGSGHYRLGSESNIVGLSWSDILEAKATGGLDVNLPLYFPTRTLPMGGTESDLNTDGFADNTLHVDASFDSSDGGFSGFNVVVPDLAGSFSLFSLFNDPQFILNAVNRMFDGMKSGLEDKLIPLQLPLIGDALKDAPEFIEDIRGKLRDIGFFSRLEEAVANGESTIDIIKKALFDAFGGEDGSILSRYIYDPLTGNYDCQPVTSADEIELTADSTRIQFNVTLCGIVFQKDVPLEFNASIPGLGIDIDADINVDVRYVIGMGFGFGANEGFYLDTSGINASGEEVALDITASLRKGSRAEGILGFLKMEFEDVHDPLTETEGTSSPAAQGSHIAGHLGLDLQDAGGDGAWTILGPSGLESLGVVFNGSAYVNADIKATIATTAGSKMPELSAIIRYDQVLGNATISSTDGISFGIGAPNLKLEDVRLNVGSTFRSFLGDTLSTILDIVKPMKPVVDILTTEIDIGIAKLMMIDMAYLKLPAKVVDNVKKVLVIIDNTIEFLEKVDGLSSMGFIDFGDFNLTSKSLEDPSAKTTEDDTRGAKTKEQRHNSLGSDKEKFGSATSGPSQEGTEKCDTSVASAQPRTAGTSSGSNDTATCKKKRRFKVPFLEDPMSMVSFIRGTGDITLFWYDLPDLDLSFDYSKSFPVFMGLNAGLFG